MVIKGKEAISRKNITDFVFICVLAFAIVFGIGFANALVNSILGNIDGVGTAVNYSEVSGKTVTEDVANLYNITFNHSGPSASANVTNVTIKFWGNFDFTDSCYGGNFSAAPGNATYNLTAGDQDGFLDERIVIFFSGTFNDSRLYSNYTDDNYIMWNGTNLSNYVVPWNRTLNGSASYFYFNATARTPGKYNITVRFSYEGDDGAAGTIVNYSEVNITIHVNDTTIPWKVNATASLTEIGYDYNTSIANGTSIHHLNMSGTVIFNVSAIDNGNLTAWGREYDISGVNISFFNTSGDVNGSFIASNVTNHFWNVSVDTTTIVDGVYNITLIVNDTRNNLNMTNISTSVRVDNSNPGGSMTCSPTDAYIGTTVTCTCTGSDNLAGVQTTTYTTSPSTTNAGVDLTQSCTVTDYAGNIGTVTSNKYTIWGSPPSTPPSGGPVTSVSTINQINPETPVTVSGFAADSGVAEIQIEVSQTANSVKVNVGDYSSTPSAVSVSKSGSYKYMHIETQNLGDKLSKATMKIKVAKTWVAQKEITKDDVALFKYDEDNNVWDELTTIYDSEDDDYYYYTVEVDNFSYFSIAPKEGVVVGGEEEEQPEEMNLTWLWIVIGVIVVVAIVAGIALKKRKK